VFERILQKNVEICMKNNLVIDCFVINIKNNYLGVVEDEYFEYSIINIDDVSMIRCKPITNEEVKIPNIEKQYENKTGMNEFSMYSSNEVKTNKPLFVRTTEKK